MNNKKTLKYRILLNKIAVLLVIFAFLSSYLNLETYSNNFSQDNTQTYQSDFSYHDVVKRSFDHQNDESDKPEPYNGEKESNEGSEDSEDSEENEKRERERENDVFDHCVLDAFSLNNFSSTSSFYTVCFFREVLSIPYYILFHNWKLFLS